MRMDRHHRISRVRYMLALVILVGGGCNGVVWNHDLAGGMRTAAESRRRVLVVFCSASSPDCREMDWTVWNDAKVQEIARKFVPVRQDIFIHRKEAERLGVSEVPAAVVVRADGSVAGTQTGKVTPEAMRFFLIKNRFN